MIYSKRYNHLYYFFKCEILLNYLKDKDFVPICSKMRQISGVINGEDALVLPQPRRIGFLLPGCFMINL